MHAKDLSCNNCGDGKRVESVYKSFPNLDVTSAFAFIIKPID